MMTVPVHHWWSRRRMRNMNLRSGQKRNKERRGTSWTRKQPMQGKREELNQTARRRGIIES